ncbi:uncharacterized protein [Argopecten irradians]|uniref:uncharacterized protein isoform X1 n=1 Tax=Argopecten irradians TaxID=31199 RepID=UPI0037190DBC
MEVRMQRMEEDLKLMSQKTVEGSLKHNGEKRAKFYPDIPDWERRVNFDPTTVQFRNRETQWVNYRGKTLQPPFFHATAEEVAAGKSFDLDSLPLRKPGFYLAGNVHDYVRFWENIGATDEVIGWISSGVNVSTYLCPFKGNFKGKSYNSDVPPPMYFSNANTCIGHEDFIVESLRERVCNGSMSVWGKVGEVDPPHLVMPLTVEPTKPRLCHDERFLNLWIRDLPFALDTLKEVPRIISHSCFMTSVDDKSGYDHVKLDDDSKKYFGVQFAGWYYTYNTLPFGFKPSAYIYHTMGMAATGYCRGLGVPCLQYIDGRLIAELLSSSGPSQQPGILQAEGALFIVCEVLTRLGYFIGIEKSVFVPCQAIRFLGMFVDAVRQTFCVPEEKKQVFQSLRESILQCQYVDVKTLQRFAGKCISFMLAVPAARLYIRDINRAIGVASKNSRQVQVCGEFRSEIEHWKFIDSWSGFVPWRVEKHLQVNLATDASLFRWGAVVEGEALGDFFLRGDSRPIHVKEAEALYQTILALEDKLENHRVDAMVDNKAVVAAWEGQGCKCPELVKFIKGLFQLTQRANIDLKVSYIPSKLNPADIESRRLSLQDWTLSEKSWEDVQKKFGPHLIDYMSLDSNVMVDQRGNNLRHYTPCPTVHTDGVNFFAQEISGDTAGYIFPPFCLISVALKYLVEQKCKACTFIFPRLTPSHIGGR